MIKLQSSEAGLHLGRGDGLAPDLYPRCAAGKYVTDQLQDAVRVIPRVGQRQQGVVDLLPHSFRQSLRLLWDDGWISITELRIIILNITSGWFLSVCTATFRMSRPTGSSAPDLCFCAVLTAILQLSGQAAFLPLGRRVRGKLLYIDFRRLPLALPHTLDQANALHRVQLCQQPPGLYMAAAQVALDFLHGVVDVYPAGFVQPAVAERQTHAIQHHPVEQLGLHGEALVFLPGDELAGDAVKGITVGLFAVEILPVHTDSPLCFYRHSVTSTARINSTSRSRIAALLSPTALHQGKAEGQGVCVATGSSGRAYGYADPVLEALKHSVRAGSFQ